jgi:hypothetical protein
VLVALLAKKVNVSDKKVVRKCKMEGQEEE